MYKKFFGFTPSECGAHLERLEANAKSGFTLAEVLITLAIIGIVAALTIPTLVSNSQKTQYVTGLKKAYSQWSQALQKIAVDEGTPGDLKTFFDATEGDTQAMGDKLVSYFKIAKNCGTTQKGCWADTISFKIDGSNPQSGKDYTGDYYRFVTADGMAVSFYYPYKACSGSFDLTTNICMSAFYIDVNGPKKPNVYGRDIFQFKIINDHGPAIYPIGGQNMLDWIKSNGCSFGYNGATNKDGEYCAGRVIGEGWQMNY